MPDILYKTDNYVFSYRVTGLCIQNNKVLLQKPTGDTGFAFPGGHAEFGETNAETLIREFKEEMNVNINVGELKRVAEIFFLWGDKPCHQICLYYIVDLIDVQIPFEGKFIGSEHLLGRNFDIEFHWILLDEVKNNAVYPSNTSDLLNRLDEGIKHFVYKEK